MPRQVTSSAPPRQRAGEPARSRAECIAVERATRLLGISMRPAPGRGLARAAGAAASQEVCELLASGPLASPPPASPPPPATFLSPFPQSRRHPRANEPGSSSSSSSSREAAAESHLPTPSSPSHKESEDNLSNRHLPIPLVSNHSIIHSLHTRLQLFLTSFFLLSNPSLCPSTCLLSLPGRATASRPTPAVNKIKYTWRTPPEGERGEHLISPTASCNGRSAATWRALGPKRSASDRPDQQWWRRVPV